MKKKKTSKLEARAISLLQQQPNISMPDFARILGKSYGHAGSLMHKARRHLGIQVRDEITKVEKTKALLTIKPAANTKLIMRLMEVRNWRAYELKSLARERLDSGQHASTKALKWAEFQVKGQAPLVHQHDDEGSSIPIPTPEVRKSEEITTISRDARGKTMLNDLRKSTHSREELMKQAGMDPLSYRITKEYVNQWQIGMKHPTTGEVLVEPLFQHKIIAEPIPGADLIQDTFAEIIAIAKRGAPEYPEFTYPQTTDPHLLEISVPDLHIGKFALMEETGDPYDVEIASKAFLNAIEDLATQANQLEIEQIVFPLGNDYLTADNLDKTTTRGTPQDYCGSQLANLRHAWKLAVEAIDRLQSIAPVEVIMVPGNHDTYSVYTIGMILEVYYSRCPQVTVRNTVTDRQYKAYGKNLLGYAHGHREKQRSLPMLMATEAADLWAGSAYREFHLGHFHHTKDVNYMATSEDDGVIVRILPSLSASDRWHSAKGYRAQRAAQALVYHPQNGLRAIFRHNLSSRRRNIRRSKTN